MKGFSVLKNNRCDFEGTIAIKEIREAKIPSTGEEGALKGIRENRGRADGGDRVSRKPEAEECWRVRRFDDTLAGTSRIKTLKYDDIDEGLSDLYSNNQYAGTWTPYGKGKAEAKTANWGEYRIPFAGEFDVGVGEFHPSPTYRKNGWETYSP